MLMKLITWLFGAKIASSITGVAGGALAGMAAAATTGDITKESLIKGAIGGTMAAIIGAKGRAHGEL